jgi:hypothetical protein
MSDLSDRFRDFNYFPRACPLTAENAKKTAASPSAIARFCAEFSPICPGSRARTFCVAGQSNEHTEQNTPN